MLTTTTVELESDTQQQLEQIAASRRQPAASLLREAVEQFVEREQRRSQLMQDSLDALHHYQTTGLHLTQEEVEVWLDQWETGEQTSLPECHT